MAQRVEDLRTGARIRITSIDSVGRSVDDRSIGTFLSLTDGAVVFRHEKDNAATAIAIPKIKLLELNISQRSAGALKGGLYTLAIGGAATAILWKIASRDSCRDCWVSNADAVLIVGIPVTVLSASITAFVMSRRADTWKTISLHGEP